MDNKKQITSYCPICKDVCLGNFCEIYDKDRGCPFNALKKVSDIYYELENLTHAVRELTEVLKGEK